MTRWRLFRTALNALCEHFEILEATMVDYDKGITIQGASPGWEVSLRIVPVKEASENA